MQLPFTHKEKGKSGLEFVNRYNQTPGIHAATFHTKRERQKLTNISWAQRLLAWSTASPIMRLFGGPKSDSKKGTQGWSVSAVVARITRKSPA